MPINESNLTLHDTAAWLHQYDLASKQEGWLLTNDSENNCCFAKIDDPQAWIEDGWPLACAEPKFTCDDEAIEFVRRQAAAGSQWHAQAIAIHDAKIPMSAWLPDPGTRPNDPNPSGAKRPVHAEILAHCSAGPWRHGLHLPGFSADSQPCVYGDERELPLAVLDADDEEASANVVLMAAAWELCQELSILVGVVLAAERDNVASTQLPERRDECNRALELLSRISSDVQRSAVERYEEEETDE